MKKLIFYFHGLGSSPNTDKVARLRSRFESVYAFPIDVDPDVSLPKLDDQIMSALQEHENNCDTEVVFVGTSLGGWYAGNLAEGWKVKCVLINPAYSLYARKTPRSCEMTPEIVEKYESIGFAYPEETKFFMSTTDEVIDFEPFKDTLSKEDVTWVENSNHRFNGPEFDAVMDYIDR